MEFHWGDLRGVGYLCSPYENKNSMFNKKYRVCVTLKYP